MSNAVPCPHCKHDQEINEMFVTFGKSFGLAGILCQECGEMIPIDDEVLDG